MDDTVETQIDSLKDDYAAIATEACGCLETHDRSAALTAVWVNEVFRGPQNEPLIVEGSVSEYSDLFRQLQKKWSFTNPTLLEQLLEKLKNDTLIQKLALYTERFNTFCSKFPIDKAVRFEHYDPSQPCLVLILNFKTFHGIKVFLEDVFDIYARYLRVHMIKPGSIKEVTIQFPSSMTMLVQDCIDQRREAANDTSMHIEPQAEGTKTSETQPTAATSAKYQTSEAAKHDMDNEPKIKEVTIQFPASIKQVIQTCTNKRTTEPQTVETEPSVRKGQTSEALKHFAELHIDQKKETKLPKHSLPSNRKKHEKSVHVCINAYVQ